MQICKIIPGNFAVSVELFVSIHMDWMLNRGTQHGHSNSGECFSFLMPKLQYRHSWKALLNVVAFTEPTCIQYKHETYWSFCNCCNCIHTVWQISQPIITYTAFHFRHLLKCFQKSCFRYPWIILLQQVIKMKQILIKEVGGFSACTTRPKLLPDHIMGSF